MICGCGVEFVDAPPDGPAGVGGAGGTPSKMQSSGGGTGGTPGVCGDGAVDPGEQCDDANDTGGDGCEGCLVVCDDGYVDPETFHCYAAGSEPRSRADAASECAAWLPGATLVAVSSPDELEAIRDDVPFPVAPAWKWLGATHDGRSWHWDNGEPWWSPEGDPSGSTETPYVSFQQAISVWSAVGDNYAAHPICEWAPPGK